MTELNEIKKCPNRPSCVSTQAEGPDHAIDPIQYNGSAAEALEKLKQVVGGMKRVRLEFESSTRLHYVSVSKIFRFKDDVEFVLDPETSTIHFRSMSRVGYRDFGVNRQRMEEIRRRFRV